MDFGIVDVRFILLGVGCDMTIKEVAGGGQIRQIRQISAAHSAQAFESAE